MDFIKNMTESRFFDEYFEKKYLHADIMAKSWFSNLTKKIDFDHILTSQYLSQNRIQVIQNGINISPSEYFKFLTMSNGSVQESADILKVISLYDKGCTVLLPSLQNLCNEVRLICIKLENIFQVKIRASAYLSPPNSIGFLPHYDGHDILVYQIDGKKSWILESSEQDLPLSGNFEPDKGKRLLDCELSKGQLLYVPRGVTHTVSTTGGHSIHITFSIAPWRISDIIPKISTIMFENFFNTDSIFRESILSYNKNEDQIIQDITDKTIQVFESMKDREVIEEIVKEFYFRQRMDRISSNSGILNSLKSISCIKNNMTWTFVEDSNFKLISKESTFVIHFKSKYIELDNSLYGTLLLIMNKKKGVIKDFLSVVDSDIVTTSSIHNFLKILVKNSIILVSQC